MALTVHDPPGFDGDVATRRPQALRSYLPQQFLS